MTASFGQLIKEQRIEMGLTQQRLADLVGRSPSTVRSWERDRATPNDETVIDTLSAVLGVDKAFLSGLAGGSAGTDDIFEGEENQPDEARPDEVREARPPVQMGPEPAPRPNGDEARIPGAARAPEPAKPYLLQTDRRADHVRPGPLKPGVDDAGEQRLFSDEAPDPAEPPSDWDAEIDLDDFPDAGPLENLPAVEPVAPDTAPADEDLWVADVAVEGPGSETEVEVAVDRDVWEDEPTQILMPTPPAEERLLGVATAKAVEYLAEPRPLPEPEPEPEAADATEVIERASLVVSALTAEVLPQATEPVRTVSRAGVGAQPRTQTMESGRPIGPNSYLDDPKEIRGYRIRAGLTTAALIAMFILARWAWAGFREQLGGILDTLTTGF